MKKSIAMKWAEALESGEYRQTKGTLRKSGAFCCLGVLCNMHAQANPKFAATQNSKTFYDEEAAFPSQRVKEWAGMQTDDGSFSDVELGDISLATENDSGVKFPEIAKLIRKYYKEL